MGQGVVPEIQIDQVTVQNQKIRGYSRDPIVSQQKTADIQRDLIRKTGESTAAAVHSVRVWAQAAGGAVLCPRPEHRGQREEDQPQPADAWQHGQGYKAWGKGGFRVRINRILEGMSGGSDGWVKG